MIVVWLFLAVPWVFLQFVIGVFPDLTHLLFCIERVVIVISWVVHLYVEIIDEL